MDFKNKFKGASMAANTDVQKQAAQNNKNSFSGSGRAEFFEVKDGKNEFRILPPHPDGKMEAAYFPKRVTVLKVEVDKFENGEPTGEKEIRSKALFIATQHGGLPFDPVELYIDYVRKYAEENIENKDKRATFLNPITGWKDKKGDWHWGINPKTTFVAYAIQNGKIGRLELYEAWLKAMNKLAIDEAANEAIKVDPFSDPFEGFPLFITRGKNEKGKTEYTISKDEPSRVTRESWDEFFARTAIPEATLAEFLKQDPLENLYGSEVYTRKDFDMVIDGLRRFDEENKYGIFENDDFMEKIYELKRIVPEPKETKKEAEKKQEAEIENNFANAAKQDTRQGIQQEPAATGGGNLLKEMKDELRRYIRTNYGEEYVDMVPFAKKEVEQWYALLEEGEELPIDPRGKAAQQEKPEPPVQQERKVEPPVQQEQKPVEKKVEEKKVEEKTVEASNENDKVAEQIRLLRQKRGLA